MGERLREARYAARLTQAELAGNQFSKSYISAVERGKMTPSISALLVLAERLEVSLAYLLGEEDLDPQQFSQPESQPDDTDALAQRLEEARKLLLREESEAALAQLGSQETTAAFGDAQQGRWHWLYAWALLQQGRMREVDAVVARGLEAAQAHQDRRAEAHLHLIHASAAAARHVNAAAEQAFHHTIQLGEQINDDDLLSDGHAEYARFLADLGRYQEAYEQMRLAQTASARLRGNR